MRGRAGHPAHPSGRTPGVGHRAGAGVGSGDEQERGGEPESVVDAVDRDGALLERLAQSLDGRTRELGELIEE